MLASTAPGRRLGWWWMWRLPHTTALSRPVSNPVSYPPRSTLLPTEGEFAGVGVICQTGILSRPTHQPDILFGFCCAVSAQTACDDAGKKRGWATPNPDELCSSEPQRDGLDFRDP